MIKKLAKVGNSHALIIEKPILDLLKIDRDTELEVSTDGVSLTIRPIQSRSDRFQQIAERVAERHAEAFEKLAK